MLRDPSCPRIRVSLVGHSYLAEENRKSLTKLAKQVDLEVISPDSASDTIFDFAFREAAIDGEGWIMRLYRKWLPPLLPSSAYLLRSADLGLRRFAPDIVHFEGDPFTPLFMQVFFTARRVVPKAGIVCTIRQNTFTSRGMLLDWLKTAITRLFVPKINRFIAVNSGVADIYRTRFGASPEQITHSTQIGVDTDLFAPPHRDEQLACRSRFSLEQGDCLIGYCGRFLAYKGIPELLEATAAVREETGTDLRLALIGKGPLREELLEQGRNRPWLKVLDSVPHSEVADFMKCLDIFVMPSRVLKHHEEHDAHALMEAMSVGIPCIGTASGAIIDVLTGAGLVVPPEKPRELAHALRKLVEEKALRDNFGRAGRERVLSRYSLQAVCDLYLDVYRRVLHS